MNDRAKAVLFGLGSASVLAASYVVVRLVGATGLHPFEIAFFRSLFCWLVLALIAGRNGYKAQRPWIIMARGVLSGLGLVLWFYGLVHLPTAEATTLSLTTVCFASLGAAVFLGEPLSAYRGLAIAAAFLGAIVIMRPGIAALDLASLAVLAATACWGGSACLVRSASRTEGTLTIAVWTSIATTLFSLPAAATVWLWPSHGEMVALAVIGLCSAIGTLLWTKAFKYGDTMLVTLTDFARLPWAVFLGFAVFSEVPSVWSAAGILLILGGTLAVCLERPATAREPVNSR